MWRLISVTSLGEEQGEEQGEEEEEVMLVLEEPQCEEEP